MEARGKEKKRQAQNYLASHGREGEREREREREREKDGTHEQERGRQQTTDSSRGKMFGHCVTSGRRRLNFNVCLEVYLLLGEASFPRSVFHVTEEITLEGLISHVLGGPHSCFNLAWNGKYFSRF